MTVRSVVLAAGAAVLALSSCGSEPAPHAAATAIAHATARPADASCGPPPPRHAWAVAVTSAGRVRWQVPLPTRSAGPGPVVPPVPAGQVAVLAQDGIVHGVRLADGHQLWSWAGGQAVYGMWRWQRLVAVLTDQVTDHSRLTGLDAVTGAVRWTVRLPRPGLLGGQAATADGGLAMVTAAGVLQVVSLADGTVRWRRAAGAGHGLTAAGRLVIFGGHGRLTGYDDLTGRPAWTTAGLPQDQDVQLAAGLALVTSNEQGAPRDPTALTAVVPATGRVAWRFDPGDPVTVLSAGPAGLTVATYFPRRLYLLDPRTGRPRWRAGTFVAQGILPLVTGAAVITVEGQQPARLVARDAAGGWVRWQDTLSQPPLDGQPVIQEGPLAVVPGEPLRSPAAAPLRAYELTGGRLAWQVSLPTFVQAPPVPVPGGLLVQPADLGYACAATGAGKAVSR